MALKSKDFFTKQQQQSILDAIVKAEHNSSGEIRVHIENHCKTDPFEQGLKVFAQLKMHKTQARNGVLFYLAVRDRKFAIIGDEGIHKVVPENFWDAIKEQMLSQFKQGDFTSGLTQGIISAGEQLKKYFPYQKDDVNELSDELSFGN